MRAARLLPTIQRLGDLRAMTEPPPQAAEELLELFTSGTAASYFFHGEYRIAGWLRSLGEVGAFRKFSRVRSGKRRRWVIFRELSAYLHRVAKEEPEQVADIVASLSTTDQWATGQLMKATLTLPDEHAARVIPQFMKWCRLRNFFAREEEVIGLAERMLASGYEQEFSLLLTLLLRPVPSREGHDVGGIFFEDRLVDFARGQFQQFCEAAPRTCLEVAEKCLRKAVPLRELTARERWKSVGSERGRRADPSSGIRSAIEEHEQNRFPGFEDGLVVAVREALDACVEKSSAEAEDTIRRYLRSKWSIFRRLAIHTLAKNVDTYPPLARAAALRRRLFGDVDLHHEYWRLVPAVFDDLSSRQKARLLQWIDAAYEGADEGDKEWFAYRRLTMLADCDLPAQARRRLGELQAQLPEAEHSDFLVYSGPVTLVSPESPEGLEGKDADQLYEFLDTWRPDPDHPSPFGPSFPGVGQELRRVVKADFEKYSALIKRMTSGVAAWMSDESKHYWATYVGYALDSYQQACRENKAFDWPTALGLADAVVPTGVPPEQWPDSTPRRTKIPDLGYDWRGVRHAVAHLAEAGIGGEEARAIPESQLPRVRDILLRLVTDRYPSLVDEREHERRNREGKPKAAPLDWHSFAINTNRPEAAHVLLRYAARRASVGKRGKGKKHRIEPKVREALGVLTKDPCRSVHSILGAWLGVLWWLDDGWFQSVLRLVLPPSRSHHAVWEAGWVAFLQYGMLYLDLHKHLIPHYERSIEECAARSQDDEHLKGLCKHLAAIQAWGLDEVPEADSLVSRFYEAAEDDAASEFAEALGHFARSLDEAGDDASVYWQRIEGVVRNRLKEIRPDAEHHAIELRAFASWLDVFIERSAGDLGSMVGALEVATSVPLFHLQFERVVEFLDAQAETYPQMAARLLRRMLSKSDRDAWYWEREKVNSVLDKVFASQDAKAHREAVKIVERMWEEGEWKPFVDHRDVIERLLASN